MCAVKSTENPMHMMRLIIEIESRFTPHSDMYPATPASMETMERATHTQQRTLGMKTKHTTIITSAPIIMHWMDVGRTSSNCNKEESLLLQGQLLKHFQPQVIISKWICNSAASCSKNMIHLFLELQWNRILQDSHPLSPDNKVVRSLNLQFYSKTVISLPVGLHLTIYACIQSCTLLLLNY